jgi:hypothetical protein
MTGIRRALDAQIDRALAAGPPSKAQEAWYTACWLGTTVAAWALLRAAGALSMMPQDTGPHACTFTDGRPCPACGRHP